jgi:hypothetical protein
LRAGDLRRPAFFEVMKMKIYEVVLALCAVAIVASTCTGRDAENSAPVAKATPSVAVPTIASQLATFRSGMTPPGSLAGPSSRDSLVRLFERALAKRDTVALQHLQITREEFAFLYYPDSKMGRPPYELDPDVMWMQIQSQSDRGLRRLVAKYGGGKIRIRGLECLAPEPQNAVLLHQCGVRTSAVVGSAPGQLFGSIIEREGRFKFVGYANRL